jgi:hypothetical protein
MSFEIQDLPDIIRIIILLEIKRPFIIEKKTLKKRIDKICLHHVYIDPIDLDKTLNEMSAEGLISVKNGKIELTQQGIRLSKEWGYYLLSRGPILELVAGLTDGSITGLVVILSSYIGRLTLETAVFAAFLTLVAVAITNFSSFFLGGITEDLSDILTLSNLLKFSLSDNPDKKDRDKSLILLEDLLTILKEKIHYSNIISAVICGGMTFLAGSIPIGIYLWMPEPLDIILSLGFVSIIVGFFLVKYRAKQSKVNWKMTLFETSIIIFIAVIASLILGQTL